MNQKLTLCLDRDAIDRGKQFAADNGTSLSRMVETFFLLLDDSGDIVEDVPVSKKLMSLVGIGAGPCVEDDYREHLAARNA